ncbi:MAG: outer membrane protein assembly factor BamD [Acidobacteria bacterium]|nr:outer membrane protein assembly factor BamD [Acidobacteriota bacterium]MBI3422122.1 outer membrane protein assembly factor BamD [Acidobacteriota bacterium]
MTSKRLVLTILALTFALAACGGKGKVKNENEYKPGRDKELYETAETKLKKGRFDEARLLYNVVITTYPDSEYLPLSKLSIADSFYLEGGSSNLEQAIGGYKDFAQYFPTHPLTCAVKLKIAHSHMRQMNAFNRDWTPAKKAELQLKATEISCRNSPLLTQIQQNLDEVRQLLGLHEREIGNFYMENRKAYKAAEGRFREIVNNYPNFTYRDEALYKLGVALIEQEQPEEASQYFTDLLKKFPKSEHAADARKYLEKLGKPIPEADPDAVTPERPGRVGRMKLILGMNDLDISKDGVLVSKEGDTKADEAEKLQKPIEAVGGVGSVRASTKGPSNTPAAPGTEAASVAETAKTNGKAAAATEKTVTPEKKVNDKDNKAKDDKKKKKKGVLGIFK